MNVQTVKHRQPRGGVTLSSFNSYSHCMYIPSCAAANCSVKRLQFFLMFGVCFCNMPALFCTRCGLVSNLQLRSRQLPLALYLTATHTHWASKQAAKRVTGAYSDRGEVSHGWETAIQVPPRDSQPVQS